MIASVTNVRDEVDELYVALSGDQCALTNIRVLKGEQGLIYRAVAR